MNRWLLGTLVLILLSLQYRLWVGEGSLAELWQLKNNIEAQIQINNGLQERNDTLKAEVLDLKQGLDALEERARNELGMIKEQESFYQLVKPTPIYPAPVPELSTEPAPAADSLND